MNDPHSPPVRQLIYRSISASDPTTQDQDLIDILAQSRTNNGLEGLSGVLLAKNGKYLQVLEGSPDGVEHIYSRIKRDRRHTDVEIVDDRMIERRAFGGWGMANLGEESSEQVVLRIERFLLGADDGIKRVFAGIM